LSKQNASQKRPEFYDAAVRKQRLGMTHGDALATLKALKAYPVLPLDYALVLKAVALKEKFQISYWDAAILAAARQLGCEKVFSEDLNDGQHYDGVRVDNPFRGL